MKRILLDESVPRRLGFALEGHFVRTVQFMGWSGVKNGQLLRLAADHFEVFITADQNLRYQQHPELPLAVVTLVAANNRLQTLSPLIPEILRALETIETVCVVEIGSIST